MHIAYWHYLRAPAFHARLQLSKPSFLPMVVDLLIGLVISLSSIESLSRREEGHGGQQMLSKLLNKAFIKYFISRYYVVAK